METEDSVEDDGYNNRLDGVAISDPYALDLTQISLK